MDDGRLPFRCEGAHRRCTLVDALKLKEAEDEQQNTLRSWRRWTMLTTSRRPASEVAPVDANVLFPHHPRNILLTQASEGVFEMRLTGAIEKEWTEALLREQPHLRRETVMATAQKMKKDRPPCLGPLPRPVKEKL